MGPHGALLHNKAQPFQIKKEGKNNGLSFDLMHASHCSWKEILATLIPTVWVPSSSLHTKFAVLYAPGCQNPLFLFVVDWRLKLAFLERVSTMVKKNHLFV